MDAVAAAAASYYWYHCVELTPGVVTDGDYDMTDVLPEYRFPERLTGMHALDVGRASGFFAFEFERRGAQVVATDIGGLAEWDWVGGPEGRTEGLGRHAADRLGGAFGFAKTIRRSRVEERTINVYDLEPAAFGGRTFDLVFAGSISSHLRDPVRAFQALRSVTRGVCVVAAPSFGLVGGEELALLALVGTADDDRRSWWVMNARGLTETLRSAGFTAVEIVSEFVLRHRHQPVEVRHLVAHARP